MKRTILLISHGPLAEAMKASASMLMETANVYAEGLYENEHAEDFKHRIETYISKYEEILILCDLPGGTPCNSALACRRDEEHVKIIVGMNLPLLLEALLADPSISLSELCEFLIEKGKENCKIMELTNQMDIDELDEKMG